MLEITKLVRDTEFIGIGGKNMIAAGLESIAEMKDIAVVGFWEVLKKYNFFKRLLNESKNIIKSGQIDAFVPVDYPGFNIRLADFSKSSDVPVYYYIAPQLWAWGKNRAEKLKGAVDKLYVVFPFEVGYFRGFGIDAEFIGHPLLDDPSLSKNPPDYDKREKIIALMPGSRNQEVKKHTHLFSKTAQIIKKELPDYRIIIPKSANVETELYEEYSKIEKSIEYTDNSRELMLHSRAAVVKTGTSNLEAALCGLPFVMAYKTSYFNYLIGRSLVNMPYISMPNILLNREIINEYIQKEARPEVIANNVVKLTQKNYFEEYKKEFEKIRKILGGSGANKLTAQKIISEINTNGTS